MFHRRSLLLLVCAALPVGLAAQEPALRDAPATLAVPMVSLEARAPGVTVVPEALSPIAPSADVSVTAAGAAALRDVRAARERRTAPPQLAGGKSFGRPEALMIIGVAGIVGGSLVGGTGGYLVSLAGLGVGLYGLYLFLQ